MIKRPEEPTLVTGKITDSKGLPLPGTSVDVIGYPSVGTIADFDGNYSLTAPVGASELRFLFIGYEEEKRSIASRVDVKLKAIGEDLSLIIGLVSGIKSLKYGVEVFAGYKQMDAKFLYRSNNDVNSILEVEGGIQPKLWELQPKFTGYYREVNYNYSSYAYIQHAFGLQVEQEVLWDWLKLNGTLGYLEHTERAGQLSEIDYGVGLWLGNLSIRAFDFEANTSYHFLKSMRQIEGKTKLSFLSFILETDYSVLYNKDKAGSISIFRSILSYKLWKELYLRAGYERIREMKNVVFGIRYQLF